MDPSQIRNQKISRYYRRRSLPAPGEALGIPERLMQITPSDTLDLGEVCVSFRVNVSGAVAIEDITGEQSIIMVEGGVENLGPIIRLRQTGTTAEGIFGRFYFDRN